LEKLVKKKLLRRKLETSQIAFTKFFFRVRKEQFIAAEHHAKINAALLQLEAGTLRCPATGLLCTNLLITIAPRFGKTQFCVIDWMARCLAKNPRAKFIHLSYSDDLALDNSAKCRDIVQSAEFQDLWPVRIRADTDSKKKWYSEEGGGVYATAAGGPVTGFGAGSIADGKIPGTETESEDTEFFDFFQGDDFDYEDGLFYGAIVIDDPIKVDDAFNEKLRNAVTSG